MTTKQSRDSSVGIAIRYGLDGPRIESRCETDFSARVQTGPGAHPASYTMGTGSFTGVKRPEHGVDHPPQIAPRLKKIRAIPLLLLSAFMACWRASFTFTFMTVGLSIRQT